MNWKEFLKPSCRNIVLSLLVFVILILSFNTPLVSSQISGKTGEYFNVSVINEYFCVYITDPTTIQLAYENYQGKNMKHIGGSTSVGDGGFNKPWSWHLIPDTVRLVEASIEVCDAKPSYVETHLSDFGTYCPWTSRIFKIGCSGVVTTTTITSTKTTTTTSTSRTTTTIIRRGGSCPILKVYNDDKLTTIGKMNIHSPKDQDTTYTLTFTMQPVNGKYQIILDEAAYLFWDGSHINSVKLTGETGKECKLISATHSKQGDVLSAITTSDDVRVRSYPDERIKLTYDGCSGNKFTFSIEGYNVKTPWLGLDLTGSTLTVVVIAVAVIVAIYGAFILFAKKK